MFQMSSTGLVFRDVVNVAKLPYNTLSSDDISHIVARGL